MYMYDNSSPCDAYDTQMFRDARYILEEHRERFPIGDADSDRLCELQAKAWIKYRELEWFATSCPKRKEQYKKADQPYWEWGDVGAYAVVGDLENYYQAYIEHRESSNHD